MNIIDNEEYECIFNGLADTVEFSENKAVAALQLLNASIAIAVSVLGPDAVADALDSARGRLHDETARAARSLQ